MSKPKYADLGDMDEDARIEKIGQMAKLMTVGFVTDATPGKAERYIEKLQQKFPGIVILKRFNGPVPGTVTVKVGPQVSQN